jgi:hypothetical protein
MKTRIQASLTLIVALAMMGLASCDHYNCASGPNLGTSCTPSGSGLSTTGPTGSTTAAFVFAVDTAGSATAGTIDGFTLDTGLVTFAQTTGYTPPTDSPSIPLGDAGAGMVVAQGQFLYAGFGLNEKIYGWTIGTGGTLTSLTGSPYAAPFMSRVGLGVGSESIITNPAGTLLFFADTFQDQIYVYQIGTGGALTAPAAPVPVPLAPVNMTTDGLGKYLYVTEASSNHTGTAVAAYAIGSNGSLTAVAGSPFVFPMWQVVGEPTGKYLIGTTGKNLMVNGSDDFNLYVFSITQTGPSAGAIAPVSGSPFSTGTISPFSIAVQSNTNGNFVYSFSVNDTETGFNGIEGYQLGSTGALTAVSGSPFTGMTNGSWGQFDQSGNFLFAYSEIVDSSNGAVTAQVGPLDVGSGGVLTQPVSPLSLGTPGFWVVTDPK